jgi:speckle-type POZ protein
LWYYPDGHDLEHVGWISVFLLLDSTDTVGKAAKARYKISLLGLDGNMVPSCSMASETPRRFSSKRGHGGALVERKILEGSGYLKDDAFRVRCDITVTE